MTSKERILAVLNEQPDDATYDEIVRELVFARMVERGLDDAEKQRTISNEEVQKRISQWR